MLLTKYLYLFNRNSVNRVHKRPPLGCMRSQDHPAPTSRTSPYYDYRHKLWQSLWSMKLRHTVFSTILLILTFLRRNTFPKKLCSPPPFGLPFRNELQKVTISFVMSIRPPVQMKEDSQQNELTGSFIKTCWYLPILFTTSKGNEPFTRSTFRLLTLSSPARSLT